MATVFQGFTWRNRRVLDAYCPVVLTYAKKSINKYYHTQESCATFIYVPFCRKSSSCGGPSKLNECWKWSKHCKHVCMQACTGKSLCTMVHLCMCTCAVLLIFASCAWQSPWPLTTVLEPTRAAGCRKERPGGLKELGPLSMITLIKLALCNDWLATGFISRYYLWISASLISESKTVVQRIRRRGEGLALCFSWQVYFLVLQNDSSRLKCSFSHIWFTVTRQNNKRIH